jgi:hypothetical protein
MMLTGCMRLVSGKILGGIGENFLDLLDLR